MHESTDLRQLIIACFRALANGEAEFFERGPGVDDVRASCRWLASALSSDDLPTLLRPTTATSAVVRSSRSGTSAEVTKVSSSAATQDLAGTSVRTSAAAVRKSSTSAVVPTVTRTCSCIP